MYYLFNVMYDTRKVNFYCAQRLSFLGNHSFSAAAAAASFIFLVTN